MTSRTLWRWLLALATALLLTACSPVADMIAATVATDGAPVDFSTQGPPEYAPRQTTSTSISTGTSTRSVSMPPAGSLAKPASDLT